MRDYIEQNNVEAYYEENGELPDGYSEYERNLYQREVMGYSDRGLTWLFLNYVGGGSTTSITGYKPFFASSQYNNAISRYKQLTGISVVYGWMNVYDKKWYKKKINPTIGHVFYSEVFFINNDTWWLEHMNDKMSSCIVL